MSSSNSSKSRKLPIENDKYDESYQNTYDNLNIERKSQKSEGTFSNTATASSFNDDNIREGNSPKGFSKFMYIR